MDRQKTQTELEMEAEQKAGARHHPAQRAVPVAPRGATGPATNDNAKASGVTGPSHMPAHDKDMAREFLAVLDPNATRFTFQFFSDGDDAYAEIFHGTLDAVWQKVHALNTPERGVGVFVTISETDFKGRSKKNIVRTRALFVDADSDEQAKRCIETFTACGATPSMAVKSGRGWHFYFCTDVPCDQFSEWQKILINKVGTDPAVHDLPRVMRLPGTLHLKDPTNPRLVRLSRSKKSPRWKFAELVATLGLSPTTATAGTPKKTNGATNVFPFLNAKPAAGFAALDATESLADGLGYDNRPLDLAPLVADTGCGFIREAMATGGKDYAQPLWNLTTLVATFLEDGQALAHKMGEQHPEYTAESTDALWERKLCERKGGLGWPGCNAIQSNGCTDCATCPHLSKGKSPLNLTHPVAPVADAPALLTADPSPAPTSKWPDGQNSDTGRPKKEILNTIEAIKRSGITCTFDEFRREDRWTGHADKSFNGEIADRAVTVIGRNISKAFRFHPKDEELRKAIICACWDNKSNPVLSYFAGLKWDGTPRLDKLLHKYLGADDTPLNDAIGRKVVCAIVRRAKRPGCKFDQQLVLQGDQSIRKSTFCEDLAVFPDLYTDAGNLSADIKQQMEIGQGKQILEFPENAGSSRVARDRNKATLSRKIDRSRLAYGHFAIDTPRQWIPIATKNPGGYLNDPTGERRYWHVAVTRYAQDDFLADKDQLYAEAVAREPTEKLWLNTPELEAAHDAIVATVKEANGLVDELADLHGDVWVINGKKEERVNIADIRAKLEMSTVDIIRVHDLSRRIEEAMMVLKWTKVRVLRCHKDISPSRGYSRPWVEPEAPTGLDAEAGEPTGQNTPQPAKLTAEDVGVPSEGEIELDGRI
jgi:hypothetical protein